MWVSILLISTLFTAIACLVLLRKYKRATVKGMQESSDFIPQDIKSVSEQVNHKMGLSIEILSGAKESNHSFNTSGLYSTIKRSLNSVSAIYSIGGVVYAAVMMITYLLAYHGSSTLGPFYLYFCCFFWPVIVVIIILKSWNIQIVLKSIVIYFIVFLAISTIAMLRNPGLTLLDLILFWLWINFPFTLLAYLLLRRQVRAIAPMVFAFMLIGIMGSFLSLYFADNNDSILMGYVRFGEVFGLGSILIFSAILGVGFIILSVIGWFLLKKLGKAYRNKKFSEESLAIDSIWLIFSIVQSAEITFENPIYIIGGVVAFSLYKLTIYIGFRIRNRKMNWSTYEPNLLWLRVFALGNHGAVFFDSLSKWWRCIGPICMISGPDLITTSVEPNEFLDFVGGKLSRQFVSDPTDLQRRIASQDISRDPNGKFRTNEFFCRNNTWKITMQNLAKECDFVLMDLRSFSQNNQGCIYEIAQLLELVSLERTLIIINSSTDLAFLKDTLNKIWKEVSDESPNLQISNPSIRLFSQENGKISLKYLFHLIEQKLFEKAPIKTTEL